MMTMKVLVGFIAGVAVVLAGPPPALDCSASTNGEFRGDDTNCTKFYQCSPSGWADFTCGTGTVFNPAINVCDWPYNVQCYTIPNDDSCTHGEKEWIEDIKCELFLYCNQGVWRDYKCPQGYRFDPVQKDCFKPEVYPCPTLACDSSPCQNGGTCTDSASTFVCTCPSTHEGTMCEIPVSSSCAGTEPFQQDPTDCKRFNACVGNIWRPYSCPVAIPAFNTVTGSCDKIDNVDCGSRPMCTFNDRLAGNDAECIQFYWCSSASQWILYNCPSILRFNDTIKDCSSDVYCPTATVTTTLAPAPCSSSPCLNSGTCTETGTSFTCACLAGYTGTRCETAMSPCASSPCNGNPCVDVSTTEFRCQCPPYTVGTLCDIECGYPCPNTTVIIYPDIANNAQAKICNKGTFTTFPCPSGEMFSISANRCQAPV